MTTVAFIGLGVMGSLMSAHLEKAGHRVRSYDLNGKGNCASARQAAEGAEVLITMVPDGKAVRKAVEAALPGLASGSVVVDMSSSDPGDTLQLNDFLKKKNIRLIDAPVSGAKIGARDATLCIMVGGEPADVERVRPILDKMGNRVMHVGKLGAGHVIKALNNYVGASGTIAACEAMLIGQAFGLDPHRMVEVFNASTGFNYSTQRKIPQQVLTKAFASGFSAALMTKDVGIAASLAKQVKVRADYLERTLRTWKTAIATLPAGADNTEMYKYLEKSATPRSAAAASRRSPSRASASRPAKKRRKQRRST